MKGPNQRTNSEPQAKSAPKAKAYKYVAKNEKQRTLAQYIESNKPIVLVCGFAGTGKTYTACGKAAEMLQSGEIKRIVLMRPPEPLDGQTVGFLKGDKSDKVAPWTIQLAEYLNEMLGAAAYAQAVEDGSICFELLETCRGRDFKNSFIIVDEAQLLTPKQVQALTTRLSCGSKLILCGDSRQCEGKRTHNTNTSTMNKLNGITYFRSVIEHFHVDIPVVEFTIDECVRLPIVKQLLQVYEIDKWY